MPAVPTPRPAAASRATGAVAGSDHALRTSQWACNVATTSPMKTPSAYPVTPEPATTRTSTRAVRTPPSTRRLPARER